MKQSYIDYPGDRITVCWNTENAETGALLISFYYYYPNEYKVAKIPVDSDAGRRVNNKFRLADIPGNCSEWKSCL